MCKSWQFQGGLIINYKINILIESEIAICHRFSKKSKKPNNQKV